MLQIKQFVNELMTSNCFVLFDKTVNYNCIVVDPASEKDEEVISFLEQEKLFPEYVILTHEHTDHTWGCNTLIDKYNSKVICSEACKKALPKEGRVYFQLYYDDPDYTYAVKQVDTTVEELNHEFHWNKYCFRFIDTPGHSDGSVCFSIDNLLFTGDTVMPYKPFIPRKRGSVDKYKESMNLIYNSFDLEKTKVYPGHGEIGTLGEIKEVMQQFFPL